MTLLSAVAGSLTSIRVSLSNEDVSDTTIFPQNASATYSLNSDGTITSTTVEGGETSLGAWISPLAAAGANFEAIATVDSGSLTGGTTGSALALSTTRSWTLARIAIGASSCVLTLRIRRAGSGTVLAEATITLNATKEA